MPLPIMKTRNRIHTLLTIAAAALPGFLGSASLAQDQKATENAIAVLHPTQGSTVKGTITFSKAADGVKVEGKWSGLTPGKHGFHIHEFGAPSSPDGKSAGGHFNPTAEKHG